ncbi:MAG: hypothetical protein R6V85_20395 [Polyangia bacterium]
MISRISLLACAAAVLVAAVSSSADHPECESFEAVQPDQITPDVWLVYRWSVDAGCGADPELGPLERDGAEVSAEWSHDLEGDPHEHSAWDVGLQPGVHSYELTVTLQGEDPYVLDDSVLVTGTAPADTDTGSGGQEDTDSDTGTGSGGGADEEKEGSTGGSSGCSASALGTGRSPAAVFLLRLL